MKVIMSCFVALMLSFSIQAKAEISYPNDHRQWQHLKTIVIELGHTLETPFQGIHHIYGDKRAMIGQRSGVYPQGSTFVFDLLAYKSEGRTLQEGKRKLVGVMVRDSEKYKTTGGWGFEAFAAGSHDKRLVSDGGKNCFSCHQAKEENSYVFSEYRN